MSLFRLDADDTVDGPHQNQEIAEYGPELDKARAAVILLHGRGASANSILSIAEELDVSEIAYRAPQAANSTWYPHSFMEPTEQNEPGLSSGLKVIHDLIHRFHDYGIRNRQIVIMGFSQGACLGLEYAARHPQWYGGVVAFSGGLLGEKIEYQHYYGSMEGTNVFLGCSDHDPHIPADRVKETAKLFRYLDASVTEKLYSDLGHSINEDELQHARDILNEVVQ